MVEHMTLEVQAIMGMVDAFLLWKDKSGDPRGHEVYHPSAFGKAQPLDSLLQTPYGPKMMREIRIGDDLCGVAGNINTVVAIHPQGEKPVFRLTFSDGDSAECCEDHLWEVDSQYMCFKAPKVMSLREIVKTYIPNSGHRHYQVRVPQPLSLEGAWNSMLSPYTVGVLLGDGCFRCGCPMLTGDENELLDRVKDELPKGVSMTSRDDNMQHWLSGKSDGRNIVKVELQKLGLWGIKSEDRFVPDGLLYVDLFSRKALLQGLMDSDGTVSKKGHPSFTSTSKLLTKQVAWLIKSLGGLTRSYERKTICTNTGKQGKTSYTIHVVHSDPGKLFHVSRKANRADLQRGRRVTRNIHKIEYIGNKECQCITVSNEDGLYLTNDCIVTHNCLRMMQYQRYSERGYIPTPDDPHPSHLCRIFGNGHSMHDRWRDYFDEMGILKGYWTCTNPLCGAYDHEGNYDGETTMADFYAETKAMMKLRRSYGRDQLRGSLKPDKCVCGWTRFKYDELDVIAEELNFHGHADGILDFSSPKFDAEKYMRYVGKATWSYDDLPKSEIVIDFKSINTNDFQTVAKGDPHKDYLVQLTIYANVLNCESGLLMYENKNNQRTTAFKVPRSEEEWWPRIRQQAMLMNQMVDVEDENGDVHHLLPPPKYSSRESAGCNYCIYKDTCHTSSIWEAEDFEQQRQDFYGELL
jgi:hypothetical protein